jgi:protein SCO1
MSIRRFSLMALALASLLAGCPAERAKPFPHAVLTPAPEKELAAVTLRGEDGKPFQLSALRGKWVWLYFGFTHCPDVCPAAMDYMAQEYRALAKKDRVVPVFVSVDPKRDDAAALKRYADYYGPAFVALSGEKEALDALAKSVGAGYVIDKPAQPGGDYNISHTNLVFVLDPQGRFAAGYVPVPQAGDMAKDFDALPPS